MGIDYRAISLIRQRRCRRVKLCNSGVDYQFLRECERGDAGDKEVVVIQRPKKLRRFESICDYNK